MTPAELLTDAFGRVVDTTRAVLDGLDEAMLTTRPAPDANTIAWLVWHTARGQDAQIAQVAGTEEVWFADGFVDRFGLDLGRDDNGYGATSADVAKVVAPASLLLEYLEATHARTVRYLAGVGEADLDRVVDDAWDPPVTLGVRLVSIVDDNVQHAGQAAYVRGLLERRT